MEVEGMSGYRILVVDDCPDTVEVVCMLLDVLGHEAHGATSGVQAIEMVDRLAPAIVLMDLSMPGLDGYAVAVRLRARRDPSLYLVALTGWGRPEDREAAVLAGFDDLLVKPPDAKDLRQMLLAARIERPERTTAASPSGQCAPDQSVLRITELIGFTFIPPG